MEENLSIEDIIEREVQYFYNRVPYDKKREIELRVENSIFESALMIECGERQKTGIIENAERLKKLNGTVIFGSTISDVATILISKNVLKGRAGVDTFMGTINHEYMHAHDYFDFADYFSMVKFDDVFSHKYYSYFWYWSEFHARLNAYNRVLNYKYKNDMKYLKENVGEILIQMRNRLKENYGTEDAFYDLMQEIGRYIVLKRLVKRNLNGFNKDILEGVVPWNDIPGIILIYKFLKRNKKFKRFIKNIKKFILLVDKHNLL